MSKILKFDSAERKSDLATARVTSLLEEMTLDEKIGQLHQIDATGDAISENLKNAIKTGRIGSVINQTDPAITNELQRLAVEESRLGIPLLVGRDVIHGFKMVMPIPLGQAASWNPELVRDCARVAATEASQCGVNWTFAPMIDVSRDPRWGRIAESFGEDPFLSGVLGVAMINGFQGDDLADKASIAACAKHFAGYGASESGRDYNTTNIPENELRNVYLPPFKAAADAGVVTFMTSFSDIDGVPASANEFLLSQVLRDEWRFDGFVVSDWDSIRQLSVHGLTENDREAAFQAASAGVDMEMAGDAYINYLGELIDAGRLRIEQIDQMVANILQAKVSLGLFDDPYTVVDEDIDFAHEQAAELSKTMARESVVLLKNKSGALPLEKERLRSIAVIGPMADAPGEQLGTWVFDGDPALSVTPLQAIRDYCGEDVRVEFALGMASTRSKSDEGLGEAISAARASDVIVVFLGEEAILSGEAHSRADINLPGIQADLVKALKATGKPVVAVILAGRPLTLGNILDEVDALLFAWHPGTMAGPALCDLLFGDASPSGKLPVSFPKMVGQIPIYYNHKNTGRPPSHNTTIHIDDIEIGATQTSLGMTAFHLDAGHEPQFPFGFGLSYGEFVCSDLTLSAQEIRMGETLTISANVENCGKYAGAETVQLYVRDLVGSVTRPVKELKGFQKVFLNPGETKTVRFELNSEDLSFFKRDKSYGAEPGAFHLWVGGDSEHGLKSEFSILAE